MAQPWPTRGTLLWDAPLKAYLDDRESAFAASHAARVETFSLTLNADGSVATETAGGKVTTYTYNLDGTIRTATRDGLTVTYAYDSNGNMTGAS